MGHHMSRLDINGYNEKVLASWQDTATGLHVFELEGIYSFWDLQITLATLPCALYLLETRIYFLGTLARKELRPATDRVRLTMRVASKISWVPYAATPKPLSVGSACSE